MKAFALTIVSCLLFVYSSCGQARQKQFDCIQYLNSIRDGYPDCLVAFLHENDAHCFVVLREVGGGNRFFLLVESAEANSTEFVSSADGSVRLNPPAKQVKVVAASGAKIALPVGYEIVGGSGDLSIRVATTSQKWGWDYTILMNSQDNGFQISRVKGK